MSPHLLYPQKNRIRTNQNQQDKDHIARPVANPKRVPNDYGKKNIRRNRMSPHIKEDMRDPADEAAKINRPERIPGFIRVKPEEPVDSENGSFKPSLDGVHE